jgi:hypothetical protein
MAICEYCKHEMTVVDSCVLIPVQIKNSQGKVVKTMDPIRFGDEQRFAGIVTAHVEAWERCHDCAVKKGEYHHPGCDWEECPNCHHQMLMCGGDCGGQVQ